MAVVAQQVMMKAAATGACVMMASHNVKQGMLHQSLLMPI
jgi:hypothetical protein